MPLVVCQKLGQHLARDDISVGRALRAEHCLAPCLTLCTPDVRMRERGLQLCCHDSLHAVFRKLQRLHSNLKLAAGTTSKACAVTPLDAADDWHVCCTDESRLAAAVSASEHATREHQAALQAARLEQGDSEDAMLAIAIAVHSEILWYLSLHFSSTLAVLPNLIVR